MHELIANPQFYNFQCFKHHDTKSKHHFTQIMPLDIEFFIKSKKGKILQKTLMCDLSTKIDNDYHFLSFKYNTKFTFFKQPHNQKQKRTTASAYKIHVASSCQTTASTILEKAINKFFDDVNDLDQSDLSTLSINSVYKSDIYKKKLEEIDQYAKKNHVLNTTICFFASESYNKGCAIRKIGTRNRSCKNRKEERTPYNEGTTVQYSGFSCIMVSIVDIKKDTQRTSLVNFDECHKMTHKYININIPQNFTLIPIQHMNHHKVSNTYKSNPKHIKEIVIHDSVVCDKTSLKEDNENVVFTIKIPSSKMNNVKVYVNSINVGIKHGYKFHNDSIL